MFRVFACAAAAAAVLSVPALARPLTPAEGRYWPFSGEVPACNYDSVLGRIQSRFAQREKLYWKSGLTIESFVDVRENSFRSAGVDLIPKRYCRARAVMNDGKVRNVTYWIAEAQGMAGFSFGFGVEWCIQGLDHHRAFGGNCRTAGP